MLQVIWEMEGFANRLAGNKIIRMSAIRDEGTMIVHLKLVNTQFDAPEWEEGIGHLRAFMEIVDESFHFVFDVHVATSFPFDRVHAVQLCLYERVDVLKRFLVSSVLVIQGQAMKLLLEASFRVFPPVRPIKVLMHTHEEQVARDTLVFVRGTRGAAPCGGRV